MDINLLMADDDLKKLLLDEIQQLAKVNKLSSLEKPKDIILTAEAFSIENNMITPTFKLKRNVVREIYKDQIDKIYAKLAA